MGREMERKNKEEKKETVRETEREGRGRCMKEVYFSHV